jgi:hypothetical protein
LFIKLRKWKAWLLVKELTITISMQPEKYSLL